MAEEFHQVELFGGAIVADLPATFADVSDLRQVPDNQEVYLDTQGFTSIVIEILERVDKPDAEALRLHLHDIVESDGGEEGEEEEEESTTEGIKIWTGADAIYSKLPQHTPAYNITATSPPGEKQRGRANEPDFVALLVSLVRLEEQKTDVVISINVPHVPGHYDKEDVDLQADRLGELLTKAREYQRILLETFEIKDWNLFVSE